jgi:hypothetical protein
MDFEWQFSIYYFKSNIENLENVFFWAKPSLLVVIELLDLFCV